MGLAEVLNMPEIAGVPWYQFFVLALVLGAVRERLLMAVMDLR